MRYFLVIISIIASISGLYFLQSRLKNYNHAQVKIVGTESIKGAHTYLINKPDITFDLSPELQEISGLAFIPGTDELLAIEDENGVLYHLNKESGVVSKKEPFAEPGDYEGLTFVNGKIYAMVSDGDILELQNGNSSTKHKTHLKGSFDFEGLTFLSNRNRLLLASKNSGPKTKSYHRKIFSYNPSNKELDENPFLTLDCKEIASHLKLKKNAPYFSPSALCVDSANDLFILSSVAKALIVIDSLNQIKSVAKLDPTLHLQPEGMVIDDQGILYIANEGKTSKAKLFAFFPKT